MEIRLLRFYEVDGTLEHTLISHSLDNPLKLYDHIYQVCKATKYLIDKKCLSFNGISKEEIEEIGVIIAVSHDFGKSTSFFQEYIYSKINRTNFLGNEREKSHALISAFFGWYMTEKWVLKNPQINDNWKDFLPVAVFLAIEGHHGTYKSIEEALKSIDESFDLLEKQIKNVNIEIFEYELFNMNLSYCKEFNFHMIESIASKFRKVNRKYYAKTPFENQIEQRILALFLYSILLESDKAYLAVDKPEQYEREQIEIPDTLVDEYLRKFQNTKTIDLQRNKAYHETIAKINDFSLNERIHSITLPTGLGKTLLSASWALKLRTRIEKNNGFSPRIIVSLPFLSIIEQTDEIYKDFLGEMYEQHKDRLYMPRYSIAEFEYKDGFDKEEKSDNSIDFFINIWNSEIIVSTFDQLLYSLFSFKSKHLMRFHNLFNAIIVFDEIQALPSSLWKPFELFFKKLVEVGNSHILLMSATQPGFMPEVIERVPNNVNYFKDRKRVIIKIDPLKKPLKVFIEEIPSVLNQYPDKSLMIVLNTKKSSKTVYTAIKDMIEDNMIFERPLIYLSSLVAPSQRTNRIFKIKNYIKDHKNPVVVTTQCIEAGVDIDVDYVIRDMGPLDSIFQVCGRCNRNAEKEDGIVNVINLLSDKNKPFSEMVYDNILLECTIRTVKGSLTIPEERFYELGSHYFNLVKERLGLSFKIAQAYAQYTHKCDGKIVDIKKLLRDDEYQEQFIISSLDEKLHDDIKKALLKDDRWEKRYAMKKLGKRISANSVNVRFENWMQCRPDDIQIGKLGKYLRILDERYYDKEGVGLDIDLNNLANGTLIV